MPASGASHELLPKTLALRDGRRVTVREIQPDDKQAVLAAFDRLSPDARYTRFMAARRSLSDQALEAATHPAAGREFALVAVTGEGPGERIVAGARYASAEAGDPSCEFAVTIVDDWQGQGLAGQLLAILMSAAAARGYRCMEGYVLASNTPMRRLAARLGFSDGAVEGDWSLRRVSIALGGAGPESKGA